ncbi:hypothetical protein V8C35DRAFT_290869 [Trichoderma chlorosporum]
MNGKTLLASISWRLRFARPSQSLRPFLFRLSWRLIGGRRIVTSPPSHNPTWHLAASRAFPKRTSPKLRRHHCASPPDVQIFCLISVASYRSSKARRVNSHH